MSLLLLWAAHAEPAAPTPSERGAYGQLLYLRSYARQLVALGEGSGFTKDGCPTGIAGVTFGMAKTDPWGSGFNLRCDPAARRPEIGSAGADRAWDTPDDLWTDRTLIGPTAACASVRARAEGCPTLPARIAPVCALTDPEAAFLADTCTLLSSCGAVDDCLEGALRGQMSWASCADLGARGAALTGRQGVAAALTEECERDTLRVPELVCAAGARTATNFAACLLTVNRVNVMAILAGG